MTKLNEKQITQLLGDPKTQREAFGMLVSQYSEQLYWKIRRIVLTHDDANDVLQNAFMKAWSNLGDFQNKSKISTWLYRIAVNETLTFMNKQKPNVPLETDNDGELSISDQMESDPYFDGDQTERQLQEAIATLPDKQRMVFNMKYFNEMKYEEISEVLGTSVGALKASFHIAVKKIEEYFNKID